LNFASPENNQCEGDALGWMIQRLEVELRYAWGTCSCTPITLSRKHEQSPFSETGRSLYKISVANPERDGNMSGQERLRKALPSKRVHASAIKTEMRSTTVLEHRPPGSDDLLVPKPPKPNSTILVGPCCFMCFEDNVASVIIIIPGCTDLYFMHDDFFMLPSVAEIEDGWFPRWRNRVLCTTGR
jgi:hypothetical protein